MEDVVFGGRCVEGDVVVMVPIFICVVSCGRSMYQSKTILKHYHYSEALSIFTSFYVLSLTLACHVSST
jgi:hypothetical protein